MFWLVVALFHSQVFSQTISGVVTVPNSCNKQCEVHVSFFPLWTENGNLVPLSKARAQGLQQGNATITILAAPNSGSTYSYTSQVPFGNYAVMAQIKSLQGALLLGFYREWDAANCAFVSVCTYPVEVSSFSPSASNVNILIADITPMPEPFSVSLSGGAKGELFKQNGKNVLRLKGNSWERGYLHGKMLAPQIKDLVTYYMIQDRTHSLELYEAYVIAIKKLITPTPDFLQGLKGMIQGMNEVISLFIPPIGRNMTAFDILAMNMYNDVEQFVPHFAEIHKDDEPLTSCTQFIISRESSATGKTILGRNMDAEIDVRKLTVANFVIFVEEPTEPEFDRYVHVMWPGFVGVSTGMSERGVSVMENSGCTVPGIPNPGSLALRNSVRSLVSLKNGIRASSSRTEMEKTLGSYGGVCVSGCILTISQPASATNSSHFPGAVWEGDRLGGALRSIDLGPTHNPFLVATNHFLKYTVDQSKGPPTTCCGRNIPFTSTWRLYVGTNRIAAKLRKNRKGLGAEDIEDSLSVCTEGLTEHSVVFHPDDLSFDVAVASLDSPSWDAPYQEWASFSLKELFSKN